jgi:asparagine synthase (glutamine-hydrolysing)
MCGIFGYYGIPQIEEKFDQELDLLTHRGPDNKSSFNSYLNDKLLFFGHTRLSIFDTSSLAHQPFVIEDKNKVIIFNGSIFNYLELRNELKKNGINFNTNSDTEVLIHGISLFGIDYINKCNGMWAFAYYDKLEKSIYVSRDRFGIKPLYYYNDKNYFLFSSEIKPLINFLKNKVTLNYSYDHSNLFEYFSSDKTFFKEINRLEAGSNIIIKNDNLFFDKWWRTEENLVSVSSNYNDRVDHLRGLFLESTKLRLRSDVEIACPVSGGLDSSCVASSIKYIQGSNCNIDLFSSYAKNSSTNEIHYAEILAKDLKLPLTKIDSSAPPSLSQIEREIFMTEEPSITLATPMLELYKRIKSLGYSVILEGHGSDELFCGYDIEKSYIARRPESLKSIYDIFLTIEGFNNQSSSYKFIKSILPFIKSNLFYLKNQNTKNKELKNKIDKLSKSSNIVGLNLELYEYFHYTILPSLLHNYDKYTMLNSLESRSPFLDHNFVTYVFSLNPEDKIRSGFTKKILRDSMKGIVPEQILNRKDKIGWNAPNDIWFNKKLKNDLITKYGNPSTSFLNKIKDLYFYKDTFSKNQRVFLDYYKKIHKNVMS